MEAPDTEIYVPMKFTLEEACALQRILQVRACQETCQFPVIKDCVNLWQKVDDCVNGRMEEEVKDV